MMRLAVPLLLGVAGVILLYVGFSTLVTPHAFFAASGTALGSEPSLMSEVRAPGGMLLVSGMIVGLGAFRRDMAALALGLTALTYLTFGASRLVSVALDGMPSDALVWAMAIELAVGALAMTAFIRTRSNAA